MKYAGVGTGDGRGDARPLARSDLRCNFIVRSPNTLSSFRAYRHSSGPFILTSPYRTKAEDCTASSTAATAARTAAQREA